ncbi:ribosomal protein S18-alanine N-acetyltransferase [Thiosulfativibrio zosterae]|uniref:GNAT family acetyltransferase n=1 Tax=Thiosulfativibrio zosterae TaxID=2675053 RepID=A0A6F8PKB2_9GAMM|nr:ribosomal protein S18-alanine N-acetyltransferase [Thiosulfativibrio zosterae]BBP42543.1 GNAT family acetyltransferase [Thiosulfativibrio zosterae]
MIKASQLRKAEPDDLKALLVLENSCFSGDKLSRRSFQNFLKPGSHDIWVLSQAEILVGYALVLYRSGTNLARLYSIAVHPDFQGQGFSRQLLRTAEQAVVERQCVYLRLEVKVSNQAALSLYEKSGYKKLSRIVEYYEDGQDAFRMEKRLMTQALKTAQPKPYYEQTTEFSCGPASLMMALQTLNHRYDMNRAEELQIWREATTIFMTSGHGGCSPHGLALSAWRRGLKVHLYINTPDVPFMDGVRDNEKKQVIELVHEEFMRQISETDIEVSVQSLEAEQLESILQQGLPILALISTWRLNRNKAPHWVYLAASDEGFVYINDPDQDDHPHLTQTDFQQIPISKKQFTEMARFGQKKLRALLVLS